MEDLFEDFRFEDRPGNQGTDIDITVREFMAAAADIAIGRKAADVEAGMSDAYFKGVNN